MSERKVLSKYYPPDFDPSKLSRQRKTPGRPTWQTVRLMAPWTMRCDRCGEFVHKGRKFNARKEDSGEKYFNIPIYRFFIRCTACSAEITFKTDPQNTDYQCESGAKRLAEPWRQNPAEEEPDRDAMAELSKKSEDAKIELAVADGLDAIRMRNVEVERKAVDLDQASAVQQSSESTEDVADALAAKEAFRAATQRQSLATRTDAGAESYPALVSTRHSEEERSKCAAGYHATSWNNMTVVRRSII